MNRVFLQNIYEAYNKREIESILELMTDDVKWANALEGGFLHGRENVREYWLKQFENTNPQLEALKTEVDEDGRIIVHVHQIVKDLEDNLLADKTVVQIFTFENGLIKTFEVTNAK